MRASSSLIAHTLAGSASMHWKNCTDYLMPRIEQFFDDGGTSEAMLPVTKTCMLELLSLNVHVIAVPLPMPYIAPVTRGNFT
jgi:hypothetical protein